MTTLRRYTLITPRLDRTGPCNVAVDIGRAAALAGWHVTFLYLSGTDERGDVAAFADARRFRWSDILGAQGVIHTHCLRPDLLGWLFTWNSRCTVMTTLHNYFLIDLGFDHATWKVRLAWEFWRRAIAAMSHRACISRAMLRYYRRLLPRLEFELAYNFRQDIVSPEPAEERLGSWVASRKAAGQTCLVYVGSLSARKNLRPLFAALVSAPELSLLICGQGPQQGELKVLAEELGLAARVLFAGQVRHPEGVLPLCDMLVLPSLAEGLPLAVVEALRAGLPCLLSNIAVHRELAALGAGRTFDHHRFTNFRQQAAALSREDSPVTRQAAIALWAKHFSASAGFAQYERILAGKTSGS